LAVLAKASPTYWIPPNEPGCAEAQTEGSRDIKSAPCAALPLSDSHSMVDRHKNAHREALSGTATRATILLTLFQQRYRKACTF
jgi:hypothetical protein